MNGRGYHATQHTQPSRVMFIDSRDATQITLPSPGESNLNTHFAYNFEQPLHAHSNEVILVSLLSATVPYSFYNIRTNVNDRFKFEVTDGSSTVFEDFRIEAGNYTTTSLRTTVTNVVNARLQATALPHK